MQSDLQYFPLLLDLTNFPCLVVGGGKVALRKTLALLEFNANVTVVSPKVCDELIRLGKESKINLVKSEYSSKFLENTKIAFCATDNPKVSEVVREDTEKRDILLNVADVPALCDFIIPANIKRGGLTVSISSQGKVPFLVKFVKDKLEKFLPASFSEIFQLAKIYRAKVLEKNYIFNNGNKETAFKEFLNVDWQNILNKEGFDSAKDYMQTILEKLKTEKE